VAYSTKGAGSNSGTIFRAAGKVFRKVGANHLSEKLTGRPGRVDAILASIPTDVKGSRQIFVGISGLRRITAQIKYKNSYSAFYNFSYPSQ
jgi:hypothetical protein